MKKALWGMMALCVLAAVMMAASCKNDDDDDDGGGSDGEVEAFLPKEFSGRSVASLFVATAELTSSGRSYSSIDAFYFFADGTFVQTESYTSYGASESFSSKRPLSKGTYSGAPSQDGSVALARTHSWSTLSGSWDADLSSETVAVEGGTFTLGYQTYVRQ